MTADSPPAPEGEPSLPDDVWDRFVEDSERDIRATAPKEPSARARMVARRLREADERAAAREQQASLRGRLGPRGWFGPRGRFSRRGRALRADDRRSGGSDAGGRWAPLRSRLRGLLGVLLVAVVVLVLLSPGRSWSFVTGKGWRSHSAGPAAARLAPLRP